MADCSVMKISALRSILFLVAGLGLVSCSSRPSELHRLVLIGIDGASWDVIDPMIARGDLPNFQALIDRGARADLVAVPPLRSPVVWTTFATGRFPRRHFILDFTYPYVEGRKHAVESTQRKQPAVWNIASENGRSVGVVGYYATHPAEEVNGFVVSDKSLEGPGGSTFPTELGAELELVKTHAERTALFERFYPWPYDPRDKHPGSKYRHVVDIVSKRVDWAILRDENVRRTSLKLLAQEVDLFMTYFRVVDHASHAAWIYYDDSNFEHEADPFERDLLGELIPETYRYVDEYLGEVVEMIGPDVNVILVSDHGFGSATPPYAITDERLRELLSGSHRHNGIFLAAGPDIEPGDFESVNTMELLPLLLALSGLPLSEELPGSVPEEVVREGFLARHPLRWTAAYDIEKTVVDVAASNQEVDEERLEQLKALGYIGSSTRPGGRNGEDELDFWSIERRLRREALEGELLFHLMRGDTKAMTELMAVVRERDPGLAGTLPDLVKQSAKRLQADFSFPVFDQSLFSPE